MKVPLTPEMEAALKEQRRAFKKKFGRYPKDGDPIFFDPDADTPQPIKPEKMQAEMMKAMKIAGTPADIIYAYRKTGLLLTERHSKNYSAEAKAEWQAAIDEYHSLEQKEASKADAPPTTRLRKSPPTSIPELAASPLSENDMVIVSKCLDALDTVFVSTPLTVRARLEIASVLVAMTCDSAFDSAIAEGLDEEEGSERAEIFAGLLLERAQEILDQADQDDHDE